MIYVNDWDFILNAFLCLIDMLLVWELREQVYGHIRRRRLLCAFLAVALTLILMIPPYAYENSIYVIPASCLLLPFYPKNLKKKVFFETCLISILFSCLMILNDLTNLFPPSARWGMIYIMMIHAVVWLVLFFCLRLCRNIDTDLPLSLWLFFLFIPSCTFASSVSLIFLLNGSMITRSAGALCHLVIQATLLLIDLALLEFLRRFTGYYQKEKERQLLGQQLRYQETHYKQLIESHEQIRKLRHDMKNHLNTIALLCQKGSSDSLLDYLHTTLGALEQTEQVISTGNPAFDAVLNMKLKEMKEKGILCSPTLSIPKDMGLPFSDAVTILGNLLDNALHASVSRRLQTGAFRQTINTQHPQTKALRQTGNTQEKEPPMQPENESSVDLSVIWQQGTLFLHMSNPCTADTVAEYGIGMKNVEESVRKYSGTMKTEVEKGRYITDIVLFLQM